MEAFHATQEDISAAVATIRATEHQDTYLIHYDNWPAWEVFRRVSSQWDRNHFTGHMIGLDYRVLVSVNKMLVKKKNRVNVFDAVRLIEQGYIETYSELLNRG